MEQGNNIPATPAPAQTWAERQVALYGHTECGCGSGLSPEECCG